METYLKILNEVNFNVWTGFLTGFYEEPPSILRHDCFGTNAYHYVKSTFTLAESTSKDTFFTNMA